MAGAVLSFQLPEAVLLPEDMGFHLIYRRYDPAVRQQTAVRLLHEIGNTYCPQQALPVKMLHGPPDLRHPADRLMDKQQIDVIAAQPLQGTCN